ncbi:MAG: glycosyltransferase [Flavihumibacter sp.]|nr:glycosyltransferase [Flavihumibacter sp.]
MIKAFPLYTSNSGCDYHRVRLPFMYPPDSWDHSAYNDFDIERLLEYIEASEVVVWNRFCPIDINHIERIRKKTGLKVVIDLDDWVELPWQHPQYKFYKEKGAQLILEGLKFADAVTVTTSRLASKVKPYNANVHVIPNALPFGEGQFVPVSDQRPDYFNLIYTGQSSHLEDVSMLINPLKRIRTIPDIGMTLAGWSGGPISQKMEAIFKTIPNYTRVTLRPLDQYMGVYNQAHCSIVPLVENSFNAHKSNLKLLEAAAKKLPVIVSKVPPYSDDQDAPVLWVENQSDWYRHANYLARNRQAAFDLGEHLHEWAVRKYNLKDWNEVRFEVYKNLINK